MSEIQQGSEDHPAHPVPGFQSPQWVLDQIPSCDGLFQSPVQTPPSTCGTATFTGYQEGRDGSGASAAVEPLL